MLIIGEKINGTRKQVGTAIRERDTTLIEQLAREQVEPGDQSGRPVTDDQLHKR